VVDLIDSFLFEDFAITLVQFIIIDMGVGLGDLEILMSGKCLGEFDVAEARKWA